MVGSAEIAIAAVRESEALVVALDAQARVLLFNPACERATGYTQAEIVGRPVWDLVPPEQLAGVRAALDALIQGRDGSSYESVWLTRSGERRTIAWRNAVLHDDATGEVAVIGTGLDVTHLRESEAALSDRAARLESVLRASRDGVVTILERGEVTTFSAGAERLFGYTADEVVGRNVSMLMPEPDSSAHDRYVDAYLRSGQPKIIGRGRDVTARRKDGTTFPVYLMVEEGRIGETRFFTGVIQDISARRAAERSLEEKEIQFETVFNAVPDALVISDTERRIVMCNPAFARIFGCAPDSCIGREKSVLYDSREDYEAHWECEESAGPGTAPASRTVLAFRRFDGQSFPGEAVRADLRGPHGQVLGYLALIRDVSEERRREEILRQAQKMEAVGQLTGGMAHDFNNLLTVIKGNLELLDAMAADETQREMISEALGAAEMGASLTSRMLAFARRQSLNPQPVDMNALVVSLTDLLRRTLGERIQLSTSLEPGLPPVLVDPLQLQNAVLNLALNARDAMPDGGSVAIETTGLEAPDARLLSVDPAARDGWVALAVSDTGRGIAPEIRARLGDPYVTTKTPGQGGGLGLAMVFGFVTQSGGRIAVESEPGQGASFTIYLPKAHGLEARAAGQPAAADAGQSGGRETILLVEDNVAVRRLTRRRLEGLGYRVLEAADAAAALAAVDEIGGGGGSGVDLLLTDIVMPGKLDGFALAEAVRARRPGMRLLFTSGYVDPERAAQSGALADAELLRKPSTLAELAAAVRRALGR